MATGTMVRVSIEADKNTGAIKAAGDELKAFGEQAKAAGEQAKAATGSNKDLADASGALSGKLQELLGAAAIAEFFREAVVESIKEAEALRTLKGAVESTGQSWSAYKNILEEYARVQQENTRFDSSETITTMTRLARATKTVEEAMTATTLAENLASATNKPLAETTELVNNLLLGQQRAVIMATREFGSYAGGATTAQQALDNLQRSVNGAASSEESATKSFLQLKNEMGEVLKAIGGALTPAFVDMADAISDITKRTLDLLGVTEKHTNAQLAKVKALTEERDALVASAASLSTHAAKTEQTTAEEDRLRLAIAAKTKEIDAANKATEAGGQKELAISKLKAQQSVQDADEAAKKKKEISDKLQDEYVKAADDEFEAARVKLFQEVQEAEDAGLKTIEIKRVEGTEIVSLETFKAARLQEIRNQEAKKEDEFYKKSAAAAKLQVEGQKKLDDQKKTNFADTMAFISTLSTAKNRELAIIGKAAGIANAYINTSVGITRALASAPPPFNFALAAAVGAAGAVQIATIAGIELEKGGVTDGTGQGGIQATIGEKGKREAVLPLTDARAMQMVGEAISKAGGAGGTGSVIQVFQNTFQLPGGSALQDPELVREILETLADQMEKGAPGAARMALTTVRRAAKDAGRAA